MKKAVPYIIVVLGLALLAALIYYGRRSKSLVFDNRVTLKANDDIPYGLSATKALLPVFFNKSSFFEDIKPPGYWDHISFSESRQALVMISQQFYADGYELNELLKFVKAGNYVFISARSFSSEAENFFHLNTADKMQEFGWASDSLVVQTSHPPFAEAKQFSYPGLGFDNYFGSVDEERTVILGRNGRDKINFVRMNAGDGAFFIHTAPLAFSNYFVLHGNNSEYLQKCLSAIPADVDKLVLNDYYRRKQREEVKKRGILSVLMRYRSFRYGLITAAAVLVLFLLMQMRRRQRMIPVHVKPKNESLDFVKTMGRLYHDRRDHGNLARKMSIYFLEHVRTRYKVNTQHLDPAFIETLSYKSGYPVEKLGAIVSYISQLNLSSSVWEGELAAFHRLLEEFYQTT